MGVISFQIKLVPGFSIGSFSTEVRRRFFENYFRQQLLQRRRAIYNHRKIFFPFLQFCHAFPELYFLSVFLMHQENCSSAKTVFSIIWVPCRFPNSTSKTDEQTGKRAKCLCSPHNRHQNQLIPLIEITFSVVENCYCFTS